MFTALRLEMPPQKKALQGLKRLQLLTPRWTLHETLRAVLPETKYQRWDQDQKTVAPSETWIWFSAKSRCDGMGSPPPLFLVFKELSKAYPVSAARPPRCALYKGPPMECQEKMIPGKDSKKLEKMKKAGYFPEDPHQENYSDD
ncbi:MAG TPA: hypothetical protein PLM79_04640 [Syntrophobacteraceae bacterium]|nr:hypothetical protein [Syntrophobacteraceae bacterium]